MEKFVLGEQVSILEESGIYLVREIFFDTVRIEDEFGFDQIIETKFIVKRRKISIDKIQEKDRPPNKTKSPKKELVFHEIDLHIENLISIDLQMSPHDKFTLQIERFKQFANQMIQKKITKFRVIHGVGEGRLKSEIRLLVDAKSGIKMHDDNIFNGKVGASLIEMQVNKVVPF